MTKKWDPYKKEAQEMGNVQQIQGWLDKTKTAIELLDGLAGIYDELTVYIEGQPVEIARGALVNLVFDLEQALEGLEGGE